MLNKVWFKQFKKFKDQKIPLKKYSMTLVAGGNNSGKSTLLHGLAIWEFCRIVLEAEKGRKVFLSDDKSKGLGVSSEEFSPINVPSLKHLWTNLSPQKTEGMEDGYTLRIGCEWGEGKYLEFGLSLANDRLFVKATGSNITEDDELPKIAYLPPFAGITDRETRLPGAIRRRKVGEGLAGAVLRNNLLDLHKENSRKRTELRGDSNKLRDSQLRKLRNEDSWELLQQALRKTFGAELVVSPFNEEYHTYIRVEISKGDLNGYKLTKYPNYKNRDLMVEGSGFLQWLSVYALAADDRIDVLLLDEPDSHLHCSLQREMINSLSGLADATNKQILLATHSTEIIKHTQPGLIMEMRTGSSPRYLTEDCQIVGVIAGLGSEYSPKIDSLKKRKHLLMVEGEFDVDVLKVFAKTLGREWPSKWVVWPSATGHKERKYFFQTLKQEIPDLVAVSLRDRDDCSLNSIDINLRDKSIDSMPDGFNCIKWRRRHIESYLIWPRAVAVAIGMELSDLEGVLREKHALAVGENYARVDAPVTILDVRGKEILEELKADRLLVAEQYLPEEIPADIIRFLDILDQKV